MREPPLDSAARAAEQLRERTGVPSHDAVVVLGTGLGPAAPLLGADGPPLVLTGLSGFADPSVSGHRAHAWSVDIGGCRSLVVGGRVHLYEGRSPDEVVHLVRAAVLGGCRTVVLTAAAGGIRSRFSPGEVVLIADHLNLTGRSPLTGVPVDHPLGTPFVDLTDLWSPRLRQRVKAAEPSVTQGVYAQMLGPQLETPAEIRMLDVLGADLVGMSTALEAVAARHLGAEVVGLAVVTNPAAGLGARPVSVEEIRAGAASALPRLARLIRAALS